MNSEERHVYCEIDFNCIGQEMYDELKVGDRIQIFALKSYNADYRSRYDYDTHTLSKRILYLENTQQTKIKF